MKLVVSTTFFLLFTCFFLNAQSSLVSSAANHFITEDWSFFSDQENKVMYIDFEKITVNLSDISIKNTAGEVVLKEEVWQLPVNTIFEVNYGAFKPGTYQIELRSYTNVFKKEFTIL